MYTTVSPVSPSKCLLTLQSISGELTGRTICQQGILIAVLSHFIVLIQVKNNIQVAL